MILNLCFFFNSIILIKSDICPSCSKMPSVMMNLLVSGPFLFLSSRLMLSRTFSREDMELWSYQRTVQREIWIPFCMP